MAGRKKKGGPSNNIAGAMATYLRSGSLPVAQARPQPAPTPAPKTTPVPREAGRMDEWLQQGVLTASVPTPVPTAIKPGKLKRTTKRTHAASASLHSQRTGSMDAYFKPAKPAGDNGSPLAKRARLSPVLDDDDDVESL